ncbi:glycosyltransferase [Clostridium estertheticum]|uniref:glycosyltransferase n=1 Tax=Clostridium estertheticum TaxID=238834 RepID=UPI001C0ACAFA|nr:glycosyltransferase [Clostridium estertheticum]MBU3073200.1 hypothetical protein [Clostridium estertheticum]MBU3163559.1 hypothetical protein [Clostridium estertheticum]
MKYAYLTIISTDDYLYGVLVLNNSLLKTKSNISLVVLVTQRVSVRTEKIINDMNIATIRVENSIELLDNMGKKNVLAKHPHWNNTLDKLFMFELTQYSKIVYLDSDMLVINNIDHLFEKEHMSAVIAGKSYPGNEAWCGLNSGLMVIKPEKGLIKEFIKLIPIVDKEKECFGDQDIIQKYYKNWGQNRELELDEKYNMFLPYVDYYIKNKGYNLNGNDHKSISVIHFIQNKKPWNMSKVDLSIIYIKLLVKNKLRAIEILFKYRKILNDINTKLFG